MEMTNVIYESGELFEKALVRTLAGEHVLVSKVYIGVSRMPFYEIMVFKANENGKVTDYNQFEVREIMNPTVAKLTFKDTVTAWCNETRTLLEIKPDHIVCA